MALAQAGASIVAVGRSSMAETEKLCRAAGSGSFRAVSADLATLEPIERIVAESLEAGRIDILVNNAGIIRRADAIDFTEDDWDAVMDVNLKSTFFLSQAVGRRMLADGKGGKIINIASLLSFQGGIRVPSYTASKSGLAGLTRLLACEWAARASTSTPSPPAISSPTIRKPFAPIRNAAATSSPAFPPAVGAIRRISAEPLSFSPPAAHYVHGIVLPVDGGWLAR